VLSVSSPSVSILLLPLGLTVFGVGGGPIGFLDASGRWSVSGGDWCLWLMVASVVCAVSSGGGAASVIVGGSTAFSALLVACGSLFCSVSGVASLLMVFFTLAWWVSASFRLDSFGVSLFSFVVDPVLVGGVWSDGGGGLVGGIRFEEGCRGLFAWRLVTVSRYFLRFTLGFSC
jgi:hypothetical protein